MLATINTRTQQKRVSTFDISVEVCEEFGYLSLIWILISKNYILTIGITSYQQSAEIETY